LLRSYTLNHQVLENLNWRTSWYQKQLFVWNGLYTNEPFVVQENGTGMNAEGIDVVITPIDDKSYKISADGTAEINQSPTKIDFTSTGQYGIPFSNNYFHFTLHLKENNPSLKGEEFKFRFNNIEKLTHSYLKKLKIELTDKKGEVLRISLEGTEPLREVHYLNELIRVYIDQKLAFQTETQKRSLQFIENQLSGISDSLNAAGSSVTEVRSRNQIVDISAQGELVMKQLGDIEKEKSQNQMQLDYFKNLLRYLKNKEGIKNVVMPSVVGIQDPSLNAVVLKLTNYTAVAKCCRSVHARTTRPWYC
jgi:hypothetical protein